MIQGELEVTKRKWLTRIFTDLPRSNRHGCRGLAWLYCCC